MIPKLRTVCRWFFVFSICMLHLNNIYLVQANNNNTIDEKEDNDFAGFDATSMRTVFFSNIIMWKIKNAMTHRPYKKCDCLRSEWVQISNQLFNVISDYSSWENRWKTAHSSNLRSAIGRIISWSIGPTVDRFLSLSLLGSLVFSVSVFPSMLFSRFDRVSRFSSAASLLVWQFSSLYFSSDNSFTNTDAHERKRKKCSQLHCRFETMIDFLIVYDMIFHSESRSFDLAPVLLGSLLNYNRISTMSNDLWNKKDINPNDRIIWD